MLLSWRVFLMYLLFYFVFGDVIWRWFCLSYCRFWLSISWHRYCYQYTKANLFYIYNTYIPMLTILARSWLIMSWSCHDLLILETNPARSHKIFARSSKNLLCDPATSFYTPFCHDMFAVWSYCMSARKQALVHQKLTNEILILARSYLFASVEVSHFNMQAHRVSKTRVLCFFDL